MGDERLVERAPDERDALLHEVRRLLALEFGCLGRNEGPGLGRGIGRPEELVDRAEVDREREDLTAMGAVNPVHVIGEAGEPVDVLPDPFVGGVEEVSPVLVDLDARLRIRSAVGIPPDVAASLEDQHPHPQPGRALLGHRQAEQPGPDDKEVGIHTRSFDSG